MRWPDAVIFLNGVSTFGSGLAYPFTAIYLASAPNIGIGGVAVFYGAAAVANLLVTAVLAAGWAKPPPALLGVAGTIMLALGWLGTPTAGSLVALAGTSAVIGAGQAGLSVAVVPVLNSLITADERRTIFARRYRAINIGLGLGAVVSGVTTGFFSADVVPWLLAANGLSYVPLTVVFVLLYRRAIVPVQQETAAGERVRLGPAVLLAGAFQLGAYLFAFGQFEATAPLVAVQLAGLDLAAVSVLLLVNTGVVVFGQKPVTSLLARRNEAFGLRVTVVLWAIAYGIAAMTSFGPTWLRLVGMVVFAFVFALGECAYSCSFHPWLIASAGEENVTRASALSSGMMGLGMAAGPSIGAALVLSGSAVVVWLVLAVLSVLTLLTVVDRKKPSLVGVGGGNA